MDVTLSGALCRIEDLHPEKKKSTVLLLGRYRRVKPANFHELTRNHDGLDLQFMTVHG